MNIFTTTHCFASAVSNIKWPCHDTTRECCFTARQLSTAIHNAFYTWLISTLMHLKWQISGRLETFTTIKSDNISSSQVSVRSRRVFWRSSFLQSSGNAVMCVTFSYQKYSDSLTLMIT